MAEYFSSEAVERIGRRLHDNESPAKRNETKIAIVDNGIWRIASSDIKAVYDFYATGAFLTYEMYVVSSDKLIECADKGREKSVYLERYQAVFHPKVNL